MPKTAPIAFSPANTLFGRMLAGLDRVLMGFAEIAIRNGEVPHFGL